jgi:hypothetical protein
VCLQLESISGDLEDTVSIKLNPFEKRKKVGFACVGVSAPLPSTTRVWDTRTFAPSAQPGPMKRVYEALL